MKYSFSFIICCFLLALPASAQDFSWVKFFQGQHIQRPISLSVDAAGNQYASFQFFQQITFDSINITRTGIYYRGLILKQDSAGNVLWYKVAENIGHSSGTSPALLPLGSAFNSSGNFLFVFASNYDVIIGNDTIAHPGTPGSSYVTFLAEFDTSGNLLEGRVLVQAQFNISCVYICGSARKIFCDDQDNLYISLNYSTPATVYDTSGTQTIGTTSGGPYPMVLKFSGSGKKYEWARVFPFLNYFSITDIDADLHGNVYVGSYWYNNSFTFGGSTISPPHRSTGAVFILDQNGNDQNWFHITSSENQSAIHDVAVHDSNTVYISGEIKGDSVLFGNIWKKTPVNGVYRYFARYKINGDLVWVKIEDTTYHSFGIRTHNREGSITQYEGEFVYLSYSARNYPIGYDGQIYSPSSSPYSDGMQLKFDKLGNILWGFRTTRQPFIAMGTDDFSNLYFSGSWLNDTITFGNYSAASTHSYDGFIGKTFDYGIFRGEVSSGPYCAGDTIEVPYTIHGNYGDSNYFVAEISDEFGNFTGGERELGRIKSKDSGTVVGVLPLFQVASSDKYRIRIRSTIPQVQSFYRLDTLRLLVYSRDNADPGGTETICRGDTFMLNTYGGTQWEWSPAYRMNDSTLRQPLIWPDSTTTYRIVISDTSGCGEADTAFKSILVRDDPKIESEFTDSSVCNNTPTLLKVNLSLGDTAGYHVRWYKLGGSSPVLARNSTPTGTFDTLSVTAPSGDTAGTVYMAVLNDSCSMNEDTAYIRVRTYEPLKIELPLLDTTLCKGAAVQIIPALTGGRNSTYKVNWHSTATYIQIDSLVYSAPNVQHATIITATFTDNCMMEDDSAQVDIHLFDSLQIQLGTASAAFNDTLLCPGQSLNLINRNSPGNNVMLQYQWFAGDSLLSTGSGFQVHADSIYQAFATNNGTLSQWLRLHYTDACFSISDSVLVTIPGKVEITSAISDTIVCRNTPFYFKVNLNGGDSSAYAVTYFEIDGPDTNLLATHNPTTYSDSLSLNIAAGDTGGTVFLALLDDGCNEQPDTVKIRVRSHLPLSLGLPFTDTTVCSGAELTVHPTGSNGNGDYNYTWHLLPNSPAQVGDSLKTGPVTQMLQYKVVLDDHCQAEKDSSTFTIRVFEQISAEIATGGVNLSDTIFCPGRELIFLNSADTFPDNTGIDYKWFVEGILLKTNDTATFNADNLYGQFNPSGTGPLSLNLKLQFGDICTTVYDSVLMHIPAPLEVTITGDTLVCPGKPVVLKATATGGLQQDYMFNWFHEKQGNWTDISTDPQRVSDTVTFFASTNPQSNGEVLAVSLKDGCNTDTVLTIHNLEYFSPLELTVLPDDTLLCHGTSIDFMTSTSGGSGMDYKVQWFDESGTLLDSGFTLMFDAEHSGNDKQVESKMYQAVLTDGCMPQADTATFTWRVNPPLMAMIQNQSNTLGDTVLCYGESLTLQSAGMGGIGMAYTYTWKLDGQPYSASPDITLFSDLLYDSLIQAGKSSVIVTLEMNDGCTGEKDSVNILIDILPPLDIQLTTPDTLCHGNDWIFGSAFSGGDTSNYLFQWYLNGAPVSQDSLFDFNFDDFLSNGGSPGTQTLEVIIEDNCSTPAALDSFQFIITEPLMLDITADKPCADPEITLSANASGGKPHQHLINWFDDSGNARGTGNTINLSPDRTLNVFAVLTDNCTNPEARDSIIIYPLPQISITQSDTAGCEPLQLEINISKENTTNYRYSLKLNGTLTDSFVTEEYTLILNNGNYLFELEAKGDGGCARSYFLNPIEVYPLPVANFSWDPSRPTWNNKTVRFINQSTEANSYTWEISSFGTYNEIEPTIAISDTGTHLVRLIAMTNFGCSDTSEKSLTIFPTYNLYLPNAFSPNSDNFNDRFIPQGTGFQSYDLKIFNRWGQLLFEGDETHHWDGTYRGELVMEGAYPYILQAIDDEDNRHLLKGTIQVLR
ncbi:MAG: gliding motility-associated C-terminal domain-containing protein [Bacteroidia bacterium]